MNQIQLDFKKLWSVLKTVHMIESGYQDVFGMDDKGYDWRDDLPWTVHFANSVFEENRWGVNRVHYPRFKVFQEALITALHTQYDLTEIDLKVFQEKLPMEIQLTIKDWIRFVYTSLTDGDSLFDSLEISTEDKGEFKGTVYGLSKMIQGLETLNKLQNS